jgi:prolipoprotein diacylglyceryltransferase
VVRVAAAVGPVSARGGPRWTDARHPLGLVRLAGLVVVMMIIIIVMKKKKRNNMMVVLILVVVVILRRLGLG